MVPSPSLPSTQARVRAFDWLRGLAVLVMIETHAMPLLGRELSRPGRQECSTT